jgi:hypothetical protein
MNKIKLYVSHIVNLNDKGLYGFEDNPERINKNLSVIFRQEYIDSLKTKAQKHSEGINSIYQFCQFIIYLRLEQDLTGKMALFDCRDNMDTALDLYNTLEKIGRGKIQKDDLMNLFLAIRKEYEKVKEMAELTKA